MRREPQGNCEEGRLPDSGPTRWLSAWTTGLLVSLALGCSIEPEKPEHAEGLFHVSIKNDFAPRPVSVSADGKELGVFTTDPIEFDVIGRTAAGWAERPEDREGTPASFVATVVYPCGPKSFDVPRGFESQDDVPRFREQFKAGLRPLMPLAGHDIRSMGRFLDDRSAHFSVSVDNRGGPGRVLSLGQMRVDIAAGATSELRLPVPDCESGKIFRLDGQEIGRASGEKAYVVDATGKRCYSLKEVRYVRWPAYDVGPREGPRLLRHNKLHELDPNSIFFFLSEPPERQQVHFHQTELELIQLTDASCR